MTSNQNDKVFAKENHGNNVNIFVREILENQKLLDILYRLDCQEVSLTRDGYDFLQTHYGLDVVSGMILQEIQKGVDFKYTSKEDIIAWLKGEDPGSPLSRARW